MNHRLCALTLLTVSGAVFAKYGEMVEESGGPVAAGAVWLLVCLALVALMVIEAGTSRRRIKVLEALYTECSGQLHRAQDALAKEVAERNLHYRRYWTLQAIVQEYCEGLTSEAAFAEAVEPHLDAARRGA